MDNADLNYIKKHYGENFAKLCRGLFSTILETPGFLSKIISVPIFNEMSVFSEARCVFGPLVMGSC